MEQLSIVTDDALKSDSDAEVVKTNGLETEVKTDGEVAPTDGATAPKETDAELLLGASKPNPEAAKLAWSLRNERRAREIAEQRLAELDAKLKAPVEDKPISPDYDDFSDNASFNQAVAGYHEKLTDWKIKQREQEVSILNAQTKRNEEIRKLDDVYNEKAARAIEKYHDYMDIVEKSPFTFAMEEAIKKSDNSAELAYHISKNPTLQEKLLNSSPVDVAMEIHKLDLRFTQALKQRNVSSAPSPINPVKGDETGNVDELTMSNRAWIDKKNKEEFNKRR